MTLMHRLTTSVLQVPALFGNILWTLIVAFLILPATVVFLATVLTIAIFLSPKKAALSSTFLIHEMGDAFKRVSKRINEGDDIA